MGSDTVLIPNQAVKDSDAGDSDIPIHKEVIPVIVSRGAEGGSPWCISRPSEAASKWATTINGIREKLEAERKRRGMEYEYEVGRRPIKMTSSFLANSFSALTRGWNGHPSLEPGQVRTACVAFTFERIKGWTVQAYMAGDQEEAGLEMSG